MNALQNAFADSQRSYQAAKAVTPKDSMALVGGGLGGLGWNSSKLTKAAEQYKHFSGWSYVAIRSIASKIAGQDLFVGKVHQQVKPSRKAIDLPRFAKSLGTRVEPLESHPLLAAIDAPNPLMVRWSLMFSSVASLLLTGRAFWWFCETADGLQVWPIPSHWIEPADPLRGSWKLRPPGHAEPFEVASENVVPFVLPDPANPFSSISPLQSQAHAVATDEAIQRCQFDSFSHGIYPQFAIRVGAPGTDPLVPASKPVLTAAQRAELVTAITKLYAGERNRHNPLILDGMIEGVDKLSLNNAEMDYLQSGNQTKARILQAFGVNPIIAGEIENANRASATVAAENFAEHSCNPLIELLSQSLTRWVAPRFTAENQRLIIWLDPVRAHDPELQLSAYKTARANGDITPNEYRRVILNLPEIEGGDIRTDHLGNAIGERSFSLRNGHANGKHALQ